MRTGHHSKQAINTHFVIGSTYQCTGTGTHHLRSFLPGLANRLRSFLPGLANRERHTASNFALIIGFRSMLPSIRIV
jgi:hypothetical protein